MSLVVGIDHVQLAMPAGAEQEARSFYADLLGLTECRKPEPLAARGGCWFELWGVKIHLGVDPDFRPARKAHPALLIMDLAELRRRLDAAGFLTRPDTELPGMARCHVDDPFGNRIELIQA